MPFIGVRAVNNAEPHRGGPVRVAARQQVIIYGDGCVDLIAKTNFKEPFVHAAGVAMAEARLKFMQAAAKMAYAAGRQSVGP
jgi:hypothetical protein